MESPYNSTPEWIDPNGSKPPAYLRKEKGKNISVDGFLNEKHQYEVETHFQRIQRERETQGRFEEIKTKTEKELQILENKFPRLFPQLLVNLRLERNFLQNDHSFFKKTPDIVAEYIKSHQTDLQRIEDLLDPKLSDEDIERKIQELEKKPIKNSPFWHYVYELTNTDSQGEVRVIDLETYSEDSDYEYVPVKNVRFSNITKFYSKRI
jgi:hypothetical protein